jgi:hypothetical protein
MSYDPIVLETHRIRQQLMKAAGNDLHQAIVLARQARSPDRVMYTRPARTLSSRYGSVNNAVQVSS